MGSRAFRTPVRAGKPRGPTLVSICVRSGEHITAAH
nr:MAG TPA: hypothetical protein [Caudoviricetes sp.]